MTGLSDKFRSRDDVRLTPDLAFIVSLVYCQGADGEAESKEQEPSGGIQEAFSISDETTRPIIATVILGIDNSIFF